MTGGRKIVDAVEIREARIKKDLSMAWPLLWKPTDGGWTLNDDVKRLWVMTHSDRGIRLPGKEHSEGAKILKNVYGATTGYVKIDGKSRGVLRGIVPIGFQDEVDAIHALVMGALVPLHVALDAHSRAGAEFPVRYGT